MKPLIIIGLDGSTWPILNNLINKGYLKNFNKLLKKGISRDFNTVFPAHTAAIWASFATGKNPGKHGIFEWMNIKSKSISNRQCIDSKTFYETLVEHGYSVCLINLPLSDPPRIEGDLITSFITAGDNFVFPPSLKKEINFNNYIPFLSPLQRIENLEDNILKLTKSQIEVVKQLYERKKYDLFFYLFSAPDWLQHSRYDTLFNKEPKKNYEKCLEIFEEIDKFFGWLIEKDINLIIISDHGFEKYDSIFYVNVWLEKLGLINRTKNEDMNIVKSKNNIVRLIFWGSNNRLVRLLKSNKFIKNILLRGLNLTRKYLPTNVFLRIESNLADGIDLNKSKAFCPRSELSGIYLNDKRFEGLINNKEFESIRKDIISKLNKTGFVKAIKKEEIYHGKNLVYAPDILLLSNKYKIQGSLINKYIRNLPVFYHGYKGIFVASGDINKKFNKKELSILDIAPTVLDYFGIKPDKDIDGSNLNIFIKNK